MLAQITVDVGAWLEAFQVLGPFLGLALFLTIVHAAIIVKIQERRLRWWAQAGVLLLMFAACATALIVGAINAF